MHRLDNKDLAHAIVRENYMEPQWKKRFAYVVFKINRWDDTMARRTYRIELKIDLNDEARHEPLKQIVTQYARDLLGSAMLLQDGRKPIVAVLAEDSFVGTEEIELLPESEEIHQP